MNNIKQEATDIDLFYIYSIRIVWRECNSSFYTSCANSKNLLSKGKVKSANYSLECIEGSEEFLVLCVQVYRYSL